MAPMRVKSRPFSAYNARDLSPVFFGPDGELPDIVVTDSFRDMVKKLSVYFVDVIQLPSTFEQLRTTSAGDSLRVLVDHLSDNCTNPAIVNALLALKWHYGAASDERGLNEARANGCEIVAWRFLTRLSERDAVQYCLYEIPEPEEPQTPGEANPPNNADLEMNEQTSLLNKPYSGENPSRVSLQRAGSARRKTQILQSLSKLTMSMTFDADDEKEDPTLSFTKLNALEIAAIADAKRFLSQHVVQKIITGIWNGDIIFWDKLSVDAVKEPRFYKPSTADPYSRLRVPIYLKSFEIVFFAVFLCLYYAVLVERNPYKISPLEILLYVWFAAFFYDELSEWIDAGSIFYAADVWNLFDMVMIVIGVAFGVLRIIGLSYGNDMIIDLSFDVLSLEALFMVPRICSVLSLNPYWGTLIPCLKEMLKDFLSFMVLVCVIYFGFLTTFSLIGRKTFSLKSMSMILTKIFYGSSYVGFDIMSEIDPIFGPPLMLIFITLSSILLMGSLTGMLSNSFSRVITHAREEYLYVYSVYVLEASTSNRLTHFYPPFNLLALVIFRPLRLFLPSDNKFRAARIVLLKATHFPIVAVIQAYEFFRRRSQGGDPGDTGKGTAEDSFRGPRHSQAGSAGGRRMTRPPILHHRRSSGAYFAADRPKAAAQGSIAPDSPRPDSASGGQFKRVQSTMASSKTARVAHPHVVDFEDDEDGMAAPSDVEVRIAELSVKIDKLTDLVVRLQQENALK